jgi:hypothetical protein
MGVGKPEDLVEGVRRGVDMFDCVMPTRNARNGHLFIDTGVLKIRNAFHRHDDSPLDPTCDCYTCQLLPRLSASPGQVRRNAGSMLNTIHNLRHYQLDGWFARGYSTGYIGRLCRCLLRQTRAPCSAFGLSFRPQDSTFALECQ